MPTQIKVAVVDNEPLFLMGLKKCFNDFINVLIINKSAGELTEDLLLKTNPPPNVIIVGDIENSLHDKSELILEIKDLYPEIKIIVLLNKNEINDQSILHFIGIGASACLNKSSDPREIYSAIINVIRDGSVYLNDIVIDTLLNEKLKSNNNSQQGIKLSAQEKKLIILICLEESTKDIAEQMNLSHRTIESMVARLYIKLRVKSKVGVALYAVKNELIL